MPTSVPEEAEILNASEFTVMPGMMDLHVHLAAPNIIHCKTPDIAHLSRTWSTILLTATRHAQLMLEAGFTTVRDFDLPTPSGPVNEAMVSLKEAFANGLLVGPRLIVGGMVHITASHFDLTLPRNTWRDSGTTADGPWEFRKLVRKNVRNGVDCMKTCISGGLGTFCDEDVWNRNVTMEELTAMVDEARAFGKMTAAHCHTADSVRMAVEAGVDTIEHCMFIDEDAIQKVVEAEKYVIPTLAFRQQKIIDRRRVRGTPEFILENMVTMRDVANDTFSRYRKAGAKFAMGTDTNVDPPFGDNAGELEVYVDLGISPMEAIQTATRNAADAVGLGDELGTVSKGKIADLIVVDGDPLKDISLLREKNRIMAVMKSGELVIDRLGTEFHRKGKPTGQLQIY
jgi:imidazolonepropionase-like amidohydrolase